MLPRSFASSRCSSSPETIENGLRQILPPIEQVLLHTRDIHLFQISQILRKSLGRSLLSALRCSDLVRHGLLPCLLGQRRPELRVFRGQLGIGLFFAAACTGLADSSTLATKTATGVMMKVRRHARWVVRR